MIFEIEFKSNFTRALTWLLVLLILTGLLMAFFPLMQENDILSLVEGFEESLSPAIARVLGLHEDTDYQDIGHFIAFIYQYLMVLLAIFAMQISASSLSKEQSYGTIEYLYSQPINRSDIVTDKWLANLVHYVLVTIILLAATLGFAYIFSPKPFKMDAALVALLMEGACLLGLGVFFIFFGTFYSALSSRSSHSEGGSFLLVVLVLLVYFVGLVLGPRAGNFYLYTPFYVFNSLALAQAGPSILGLIINLVLALVFLALAYLVYRKKDLRF